jgi:hypothetical protein
VGLRWILIIWQGAICKVKKEIPYSIKGGEKMDPKLVENITRLVVSKLAEHSHSSSLTGEELKQWNDISSSIEGKKSAKPIIESAEYLPLSEEELKRWDDISCSIVNQKTTISSEKQDSVCRPLTDKELQKWNDISSRMSAKRDSLGDKCEIEKVKFIQYQ